MMFRLVAPGSSGCSFGGVRSALPQQLGAFLAFALGVALAGQEASRIEELVSLCGRVIGPNLRPVANAAVSAKTSSGAVVGEGRSDGAGEVRLLTASAGPLYIHVVPEQESLSCAIVYIRRVGLKGRRPPPPFVARVFHAADLRGSIANEHGRKVEGAQVVAANDILHELYWTRRGLETVTNEKGEFLIRRVPLGPVSLRVSAGGYRFYGRQIIHTRDDGDHVVEVASGAGRVALVDVQGPEKADIDAFVHMLFEPEFPDPLWVVPAALTRRRIRIGRNALSGLPDGVALRMVRVEAAGWEVRPKWRELECSERHALKFSLLRSEGDIRVPEKLVRGRVVDLDGLGVSSKVRVAWPGGGVRLVETRADGRFEAHLPIREGAAVAFALADEDRLLARDGGANWWQTSVVKRFRESLEEVRLVAVPGVSLHGRLECESGGVVPGFALEFLHLDGGAEHRVTSLFTDRRGEFRSVAMSPGIGRLVVRGSDRRGSVVFGPISLEDWGGGSIGLTLQRARKIAGWVSRPDGSPASFVQVEGRPLTGSGELFGAPSEVSITDDDGRFALMWWARGGVSLSVDGVAAGGLSIRKDVSRAQIEKGEGEGLELRLRR